MRGHGLFDFIMFWLSISEKYDKLKNDPDKQDSAVLGVTSIIMSITGVLAAVGFAYLAYLCFSVDNLAIILTFIFGIGCAIIALVCFLQLLVASIFYAAYQMKLNKRAIGKVALAVSLILLFAAIVGIIIVIAVAVK